MSFMNRKSTPRAHTHFREEEVKYDNMLKAIIPVRKRISSAGAKVNRFRASPYVTPPSSKPRMAGIPPSFVGVDGAKHIISKKKDLIRASSSSLPDNAESGCMLEGPKHKVAPTKGQSSEIRTCSYRSCHVVLPAYFRWKTCDRCRSRARERQRKAKLITEEKTREHISTSRTSPAFKYEEELVIPEDWGHLSKEERFQNYMRQLRFAGKLKSVPKVDLSTSEYRSANDLYSALMSVVACSQHNRQSHKSPQRVKLVNFSGHYKVVQENAYPITRERVLREINQAVDGSSLRVR